MAEIERMIAETAADRAYFAGLYARTKLHGHTIEAAACAIREKALRDALAAIRSERGKNQFPTLNLTP